MAKNDKNTQNTSDEGVIEAPATESVAAKPSPSAPKNQYQHPHVGGSYEIREDGEFVKTS